MEKEVQIQKSATIKIVYDGQEYRARKPKLGKAVEFEGEMAGIEEDHKKGVLSSREASKKLTETMVKFFADCGLPSEFVESLDQEELEQVRDCLAAKKKG
jgi:peptide methionine sulfoxide reductase MsrB